jgi:hypothetical protein
MACVTTPIACGARGTRGRSAAGSSRDAAGTGTGTVLTLVDGRAMMGVYAALSRVRARRVGQPRFPVDDQLALFCTRACFSAVLSGSVANGTDRRPCGRACGGAQPRTATRQRCSWRCISTKHRHSTATADVAGARCSTTQARPCSNDERVAAEIVVRSTQRWR